MSSTLLRLLMKSNILILGKKELLEAVLNWSSAGPGPLVLPRRHPHMLFKQAEKCRF